jgi:hypothetical protein
MAISEEEKKAREPDQQDDREHTDRGELSLGDRESKHLDRQNRNRSDVEERP